MPAGVSYYFSPPQVYLPFGYGYTTSYLTFYGSASMPPGTYPLHVAGTLGSLQHTASFSLSTPVTTFQVTSATGSAIVHNTGQEVQVTHSVTAGNPPSYTTCGSADPNVTCRVISSSWGSVTLGITAGTSAVHGTRVLSLNGGAATVHAAIADSWGSDLPTIRVEVGGSASALAPPLPACVLYGYCSFAEVTRSEGWIWGFGISQVMVFAKPPLGTAPGSYEYWVDACAGDWSAEDGMNQCEAGPGYVEVEAPPPQQPAVQVTPGPTKIMAYKDNLPSDQTLYCVPIQANGQPEGGAFSWSTSSQSVTLQNANTANVTVCSALGKFSQNPGDVAVNVTYTVGGVPSSAATTTLTVLKPTRLVLNPNTDTTNPTGHTCIQGVGGFTDTQSYYVDSQIGARYTSYVRYRTYSVQDQFANTIPWNMSLNESYIPIGSNVKTGSGPGATAPDYFFYCSQTCRQGGSDSVAATQTITANNFTIATKAVTWTCAGVTIQD